MPLLTIMNDTYHTFNRCEIMTDDVRMHGRRYWVEVKENADWISMRNDGAIEVVETLGNNGKGHNGGKQFRITMVSTHPDTGVEVVQERSAIMI